MAGLWKIVVPEASTNYITNPVAGLADTGWAARGAGTKTRGSDYARWGIYSIKVVSAATADTGAVYTEAGYSGATGSATVSFYVYSTSAQTMNVQVVDGATNRGTTTITCVAGRWSYQSLTAVTLTNGNDIEIRFTTPDAVARTYYIGGLQIEVATYATQFIYGERYGCTWNGVYHSSTSTRDAKVRLLGREVNFDSYSFYIDNCVGAGLQPVEQISEDFAQLPGAYHQATHYPARLWELSGTIEGSTLALLHTARKNLINVLTPAFTLDQEFSLVYTGGTYPVYINARLGHDDGDTGMQWDKASGGGFIERLSLRLRSDDPFWYEDNQEIASLDTGDTLTVNDIALRKAGDWQAVDSGVSAGGVAAIAINRDGRVYIGGTFTTAGGTTVNNVTYLNAAGTDWTAMGSGGTKGVNSNVDAIVCAPDLSVYIGGNFTAAGGSTAGYIVKYTQSTDTFTALGPAAAFGADGQVRCLAISPITGYLYAGGAFANIGGVAAAKIAYYNGSAWTSLSTSTNGDVYSLAFDNAGNLYAGGAFTSINAVSAARIAIYTASTSAWTALSTGADGVPYAIAIDPRNGRVYLGGAFTTLGGISVVRAGYWNGTTFTALDSTGFNNTVYGLAIAPDGTLWMAGELSAAGGLTQSGTAIYNGARVVYMDASFAVSAGQAIAIDRNYNVWLGGSAAGTLAASGATTVTSVSTTAIYPNIVSTGAQTLKWIENASAGQYGRGIPGARLYLNHIVIAGETTTINVERGTITSDYKRPGLSNGLLAGSGNSRFLIYPGANTIYALSSDSAQTNILTWRTRHATIDGGT